MSQPRDTERFVRTLRQHADLIDIARPMKIARAPGRLDLMGGIADYSGSLVLQWPLAQAAHCAAQTSDDGAIRIRGLNVGEFGDVTLPLDLVNDATYDQARAHFSHDPQRAWAAYVAGTLIVLARERGARVERGLHLLLDSDVPAGKGVSSSAAIEVASMLAASAALGISFAGEAMRELALLCQLAENRVVGAPCGVMDQMTSACGEAGALLALLCQPAELSPPVKLPDHLEVFGIDSGIAHAVSGSDYTGVRVGAFMGYRIVADVAGLPCAVNDGRAEVRDARWNGFLANIAPSEWEAHFRARVPDELRGDEFLARYGGTTDTVTRVEPARTYAVRAPTAHPIFEHHRVQLFRALLCAASSCPPSADVERQLGELMYQSHASYSACGLGSEGTDLIVSLARAQPAICGAKITGGGSGGTVAILARRGSLPQVEAIAEAYRRRTNIAPRIFAGSSGGAALFEAR